ncbi:ankyrin repeat domain-containing protein [Methanolapillus africanus]
MTLQNQIYDLKQAYEKSTRSKETILEIYNGIDDKNAIYQSTGKNSLIHIAASYADGENIRRLVEAGAQANVVNDYEQTPLHLLCDSIHLGFYRPSDEEIYDATCALLDAKVSALRKDDGGRTCYHVAANKGVYPMIHAMIDRGVKLNMTDKNGHTILHLAAEGVRLPLESRQYRVKDYEHAKEEAAKPAVSPTFDQINQERLERTEKDYKQNEHLIDNYFQIVKSVVNAGLIDPDEKDNYDKTALDYAIASNSKIIAAFLKGEYDESNPNSAAAGGMTLHQAVDKNDAEAVKAIIANGADLHEVFHEPYNKLDGKTPLAVACSNGYADMVQILLDAGADPNFKSGEGGYTAVRSLVRNIKDVHFKTTGKDIETILKSMAKAGLDINGFVDDDENTALIETCNTVYRTNLNESNNREGMLFHTIMNLGADVNIANKKGKMPLMIVAEKDADLENAFIMFLEAGAKTDVCDIDGNTPAMYAAQNRKQNNAKNYIELMTAFGDIKADAVNNKGQTALQIATEKNHEAVVKMLLSM